MSMARGTLAQINNLGYCTEVQVHTRLSFPKYVRAIVNGKSPPPSIPPPQGETAAANFFARIETHEPERS